MSRRVIRGDLGEELLARQSMREHWIQQRLPWLVPIAAGAMAATIAIVLWHPRPLADQVATHLPATGPTATPKPDLRNALANIQYQAHYQNMRSGVRQAVGQIAVGVDGALDAPLVTGTVETARHVAGDVQEVASATWMQLRPRR